MEIDEILLKNREGSRTVTPAQWLEMSLAERLEYINDGHIEFRSQGRAMPVKEALRLIKAQHGGKRS